MLRVPGELQRTCDAKCDVAGIPAGQRGTARNDRNGCRHAGCSGFFETCAGYRNWPAARSPAKKRPAGAMDGPASVKSVAGTGTEQTRFHSGNRRVASKCDAKCDAISGDRIELLARAVVLVAGMRIPETAREAVLARLTADRSSQDSSPNERKEVYNLGNPRHDKPRPPMTTVQEIEKAIEALPLADQLRLYRDLPHLIGSAPEELDWQRLAIEEFFRDDSPDDAVYDSI